MGIEELYAGWIKKDPYPNVRSRSLPSNLLSINLDFNGVIHNAAQRVYHYGGRDEKEKRENEEARQRDQVFSNEQLEERLFQTITMSIEYILKKTRPKEGKIDTISICIDGVAAPAKINQQKGRRYRTAMDLEKSKNNNVSPVRFNNASITPGTEFMIRLDARLTGWMADKKNRALLPRLVIYSSHLSPGEGEHKLFNYFRQGRIPQDDGYHCVYGKDGDLVMLSLLSPYDNIILVREDFKDTINIKALKDGIFSDLNGELLNPPQNLDMDKTVAIRDFVVIAFFIGNDFLPRLMAFDDVKESLDLCMSIYRQTYQYYQGKITLTNDEEHINWLFMAKFLTFLAEKEETLLATKATYKFEYPSPILDATTEKKAVLVSKEDIEAGKPQYSVDTFDYIKFRDLWYYNEFQSRENMAAYFEEKKREREANPSEPIPYAQLIKLVHPNELIIMSRWYLYGLEWIYNYYMGKIDFRLYTKEYYGAQLPNVALDYIYSYKHAPLLYDLSTVASIIWNQKTRPLDLKIEPLYIGPHHQLVAVIPPQFSDLIPPDQRHLVMPGGYLCDLCPLSFVIDFQAKDKEYQGVPMLPPIDLHRIISTVDTTLRKGFRIMGTDQLADIIPVKFRTVKDDILEAFPRERIVGPPQGYSPNVSPENETQQDIPGDRSFRSRGGGEFRGRRGGGEFRGRRGGSEFRGRGGGSEFRGRGRGSLPPPRGDPVLYDTGLM